MGTREVAYSESADHTGIGHAARFDKPELYLWR